MHYTGTSPDSQGISYFNLTSGCSGTRLRRAEAELKNRLDFIGKAGAKAPVSLMGQIERLERRIAALKTELSPPEPARIKPPTEKEIKAIMAQTAKALEKGDPARRREIYRVLIEKIVVSPKSVRIAGNSSGGLLKRWEPLVPGARSGRLSCVLDRQ